MKTKLFTLAFMATTSITGFSEATIAKGIRSAESIQALNYRNIGPFRGGRATTVAGVASDPYTFYIGTTGGVWKTTDAGQNWNPISDKDFTTASVGAIAVAPSDPNVVVVGMGESPFRGVASSHGDGVYISTDGGKSFKNMGLGDTRQISTIHIHPTNPDIIWVAAQGSPWAETKDRGVYKTTDGGKTWSKTLFVSNKAGAVDLSLDATNSRILYASMWDAKRDPWAIRSGGDDSGIWKSVDGGESWKKMSKGLPDIMGKIGIVSSPAKSGRVWAIVEAKEKGGLYRSDDHGDSWKLINSERKLFARSWYYMHIFADPKNADTVFVQNSAMYKSIDGGKTFGTRISGTHGDFHDFWLNPNNTDIVGVANDGGGAVSFNGGKTWSSQMNQSTAQIYRLDVDNDFFYRAYGGQQDNSSVSIRTHAPDGAITVEDFMGVGGCESAHVAFDPNNPQLLYSGCYLGQISEYDLSTNTQKDVRVYPEISFGVNPIERKYRFNWNAPILVSSHDPKVIYHAGNHLFKSTDRGQSWDTVSPDLTKNDPKTLGAGGFPITNEVSENYATIFALAEDATDANTIWTGSDDGLMKITRDGGVTWSDITPSKAGKGLVNTVELSPHASGTAYVSFTGYKYNDHTPKVFKTTNYGKSWNNIAKGIPDGAFVRVVREDPEVKGLLYAGTELGMYVSFNDGKDWQGMQLNLPVVPVTDMRVHEDDIVISTQGRAIWVMDDIAPLREKPSSDTHLFKPAMAYDVQYNRNVNAGKKAKNPPKGASLYYMLPKDFDHENDTVKIEILDSHNFVIRALKSSKKSAKGGGRGAAYKLPAKAGLNKAQWDLNEGPMKGIKGLWSFAANKKGEASGMGVMPGDYKVRLTLGDSVQTQDLTVNFDPRFKISAEAWSEKSALLAENKTWFNTLNTSVNELRDARSELKKLDKSINDDGIRAQAKALVSSIDKWEEGVFSPERTFFQDVLNWPDRLVTFIAMHADGINDMLPPITKGYQDKQNDLRTQYEAAIKARDVIHGDIKAFNEAFRAAGEDVLKIGE